jgi:hypothetical protein
MSGSRYARDGLRGRAIAPATPHKGSLQALMLRRQFLPEKIKRFAATELTGACIIEAQLYKDNRGLFGRTFCAREFREHWQTWRGTPSGIT